MVDAFALAPASHGGPERPTRSGYATRFTR